MPYIDKPLKAKIMSFKLLQRDSGSRLKQFLNRWFILKCSFMRKGVDILEKLQSVSTEFQSLTLLKVYYKAIIVEVNLKVVIIVEVSQNAPA